MAKENNSKKPRRKLRQAQPETVRQRAQAGQAEKKPGKARKLKVAIKPAASKLKPLKILLKPFQFLGRYLVPPYIKNSFKELRQVTWPNAKQTRQLTFAVIIFSIVFGLIVAVFDYGLDKLFKEVILKS